MSQQAPYEWKYLLGSVFAKGVETFPRGLRTLEILNHTTSTSMIRPFVTQGARNLSYRFMAAEAAWILSGDNRVYSLSRYCPKMMDYSDDGIFLRGAYGPRVVDQLHYVCDALHKDSMTRQAILTTWRENPRPSKDIPCTISMQFLIRDQVLHTIVNMRSSDAWLGWPYDVFTFTTISMYVALTIRSMEMTVPNVIKEMGTLWVNTGSQHIYETDFQKATAAKLELPQDSPELTLTHFQHPEDLLGWLGNIRDASVTPTVLDFLE